MFRLARVPDIWRKVEKNSYRYHLDSIELNGVLGIQDPLRFQKGIFAICGLNGVGKSTVFTAIKDVLGIEVSSSEKNKLHDIEIKGTLKDGNKLIEIKNSDGQRLVNVVQGDILLEYIDFHKLVKINDLINQPNFNDFIDQSDDNVFDDNDITALNYLIGKTYDSVVLREIEIEDDYVIPYFQVECNGLNYDSLAMGMGEHFLFYVYWTFKRINTYGILLIEEPEVFISVTSQVNLMNFIVEKMNEHKFSVMLVTHSPFILQNISTENMLIMNNYLNSFDVYKPQTKEDTLSKLGLILGKKGIIVFEDILAKEFFVSFCRRYAKKILIEFELELVNGFSDITKILSIPKLQRMNYMILGIYDGDMRGSDKIPIESLNWNYEFLPGEKSLEEEFQALTRSNLNYLSNAIGIEESELRIILGRIQGKESHDWLIELSKETHNSFTIIVDVLTILWETQNMDKLNAFLEVLERKINS
ncbi:AAA family ATPase [Solibacillus sp. FSL R5-0449]|uniref:ATP-dependent nuclease n=1 Tax=Solibacillus sp. FSL R5-0449 TaxID=2921639 RepID=UPI0030CC21E0